MSTEADAAVRFRVRTELDDSRRTEQCLMTTCLFRVLFVRRRAREPHLRDCPKTCPYHPDHRRVVTSSPGRTSVRRREWA